MLSGELLALLIFMLVTLTLAVSRFTSAWIKPGSPPGSRKTGAIPKGA